MSLARSSVEHLDQILQLLSTIHADETSLKLRQLAQEATSVVEELRSELEKTPFKELAKLVKNKNWQKSIEALKNNFTEAGRPDAVKEVLTLLCDEEYGIVDWLEYLGTELQPVFCDTLYQLMQLKGLHTEKCLKLLKCIREYKINVQDEVQTELECKCRVILEGIVEEIKQKDYKHFSQRDLGVFKFFVPTIMRKFDFGNVDSVLLLVKWAQKCLKFSDELWICIVNALVQAFEDHLLMDSEQALHLYVYLQSVQCSKTPASAALAKLTKVKSRLFAHYQKYIEDDDKQKLRHMHRKNPDLR
jgi:hypothetical protein